MKLGILGTGMIVQDFLQTLPKLNIESLSILGTARSKEKVEALAEQYHMAHCFFDYDELLRSPDVDTVYVALPNHLHYSFSKKALKAGKHVIVEKPATANYDELCELKELAVKNQLILVEAVNIHYLPAYKAMKKDISQLGALKIVSLNYSQYSSRYDAFKRGEILPAFDPYKAGGALMDINVYNINTVVGLFGKPQSVAYHANIQNGIDTSGILTLDYGSFKAVCIGAKDCKAPILSSYQGDAGHILVHIPANQMRKYTLADNQGHEQEKDFDDGEHRLYYEFVAFIDMIDNKNYTKANAMLEISCIVSQIMQEARKQEGIVFDNDKR